MNRNYRPGGSCQERLRHPSLEKEAGPARPLFLDRNVQPIRPEGYAFRISHRRSNSMICLTKTSWFDGADVECPCAAVVLDRAGVIHERRRRIAMTAMIVALSLSLALSSTGQGTSPGHSHSHHHGHSSGSHIVPPGPGYGWGFPNDN